MVRSSYYIEYKFQSNFCQLEIWRPLYCHLALIRSSFVTIFKLLSCFFSKGQVEISFLVKELFFWRPSSITGSGDRGFGAFVCLIIFHQFQFNLCPSIDCAYMEYMFYMNICSNITSLLQMTVGHDILASTILMMFLHRKFWKVDEASTQYRRINIYRWITNNAGRWGP